MNLNKIICCPKCKKSFSLQSLKCDTCKHSYEEKNNLYFLLEKSLYDFSIKSDDPTIKRKRYEIELFNGVIDDYIESILLVCDEDSPITAKEYKWQRYIANIIQDDQKILDIGGGFSRKLEAHGLQLHNTVIIDISANEINRHNPNAKKIIADCEALPFKDMSFDIVLVDAVLHHAPQQRKAIKEIYRALKPKGSAFFLEPTQWSIALLYFLIKKSVYFLFGDWGLKKIGYHGSRYESFLNPKYVKQVFGNENMVNIEKSSPIRLPFVKGTKNTGLYVKLANKLENSFINTAFGSYIFIHCKKN